MTANGKVNGIYCYRSTHKDFALAGAASIVRWQFEPAELEGTKVPMLITIPIRFTIDKRG